MHLTQKFPLVKNGMIRIIYEIDLLYHPVLFRMIVSVCLGNFSHLAADLLKLCPAGKPSVDCVEWEIQMSNTKSKAFF